MGFNYMTAEEAAELFIHNGDNIGLSGFTAAGTPKVLGPAIAAKARKLHEAGEEFKVNIFSGASTNDFFDGELSRAKALNFRTPYQSNKDLRAAMNCHEVNYADLHLSELAQKLRYGTLGKLNVAIIEAQSISDNGDVILGTAVGNTPTFAALAERVIIELNSTIHPKIRGLHDIYIPLDPPYRREIPIYKASDRIGDDTLHVDPKKIVAVVKTDFAGKVAAFTAPDEITSQIGANVCAFLSNELKQGRLPKEFLPLQSGVGNVANAVLQGLEKDLSIPPFMMYTEVLQDSVIDLIKSGRCTFASTCSLSLSDDCLHNFYENIDFFHDKVLMRPIELSNNPEVCRRIGVISMNTALEADIFGNINSTHVLGTKMMNGIGGSGDFTRNAYTSIFSCPSTTKGGLISNIVPMVSHLDHSEHSVDVIITEQGIADLRGKSPIQRAREIINNCAHPDYRPLLNEYFSLSSAGHTPVSLGAAFSFHQAFAQTGSMKNAEISK